MPLNPPSGDMYPNCFTWNPVGGRCLHNCGYCYVKRLVKRGLKKYARSPYLVKKELKTNLTTPDDKVLFVCSCELGFQKEWINRILAHCGRFPDTTFLFQSKNPFRFHEFLGGFPPKNNTWDNVGDQQEI